MTTTTTTLRDLPNWIHRSDLEQMQPEQILAKAREIYQWLALGKQSWRQCYWNQFSDATNVYFAKVGRKLTVEELR